MVGIQAEIELRNHQVAGLRSDQEETRNDHVQSGISVSTRLVAVTCASKHTSTDFLIQTWLIKVKTVFNQRHMPRIGSSWVSG